MDVYLNVDAEYYICKTSCYNSWKNFLSTPSNELRQHSDEILQYLNKMRKATTKDELTNAASALELSTVWQESDILRTWFQTEWLPIAEVF